MGLDQSLYREVQLKGKMDITDKKLDEVLGGEKMRPSVKHEVCYWRKFNALHKYFNEHFNEQDNDNCVDMYMGIEDIRNLLNKLEVLRKKVKLVDGWVMNGGTSDRVKKGTEIDLIDGGKKKVEDLAVGDVIKVESERCPSGRAVICYTVADKDDEVMYSYNYQERGKVVDNYELCEDELPTEDGFFFGSTDYDEYYLADIDSAIEQLKKVEEEHCKIVDAGVAEYDIDYYYRAWY